MAGVPLASALAWGTFTVPDEPSRGKVGSVSVSGISRLILETAFFGFSSWALHDLGEDPLALVYGRAVVIHYSLPADRLSWLVKE